MFTPEPELPAIPPKPVAGAPTGITGVVVVDEGRPDDDVVVVVVGGTVVVVVGATVVVVVVVDVVVDVVVVGATEEQVGTVMVLSSRVTAPLRASSRPSTLAPVDAVIEVIASKVPAKELLVPRVADDVTWKYT